MRKETAIQFVILGLGIVQGFHAPCPTPNNGNGTQDECEELKACKWSILKQLCHFPNNVQYGYKVDSAIENNENGFSMQLKKNGPPIFGEAIGKIKLDVIYYNHNIVRFTFRDAENRRYEVPIEPTITPKKSLSPSYEVKVPEHNGSPFGIRIIRKSTGSIIFDTSPGGLTFEDHFLSLTTSLSSSNIFGFGEHSRAAFNHAKLPKNQVWGMFGQDVVGTGWEKDGMNLYGTHPFYQNVEDGFGNTHGVLFLNSNAMEYILLEEGLQFRSLGGVLDFFVFMGPSPGEVVRQYSKIISPPAMPAYWALGFQICRYGYRNVQHIAEVVNRTRALGIPQDVQYADIDYMRDNLDFTIDSKNFADLPSYVESVKKDGLRFILIFDPAIDTERPKEDYPTHKRAMEQKVYIEWADAKDVPPEDYAETGMVMRGKVWPNGKAAFPDFFKPSAEKWWVDELVLFYDQIKYDGIWIDMNEPSNFQHMTCPNNSEEFPPYRSMPALLSENGELSGKTLCMSGKQGPYRHYDVHSLYGWSQSRVTARALQEATGKRGVVISRSTYPGSGQWTGHWLGDNVASWEHMRKSVIGMLEFNLFGIPYVGSDICGFVGEKDEEMCQRWIALGAFYPFSRNHNDRYYNDSDPGVWPDTVAVTAKVTLGIRYRLLPYLYTLFYHAHTSGSTVVRPLFHEFPTSQEALDVDDQFLWGPAIMISPAMQPNITERPVFFPSGQIYYQYHLEKGHLITGDEMYHNISSPLTTIPIHFMGGHIIPMQKEELTTRDSLKNPYSLTIAVGLTGAASGDLFIDDGEEINSIKNGHNSYYEFYYESKYNMLTVYPKKVYSELGSKYLEKISIMGIRKPIKSVIVNKEEVDFYCTFDMHNSYADITFSSFISMNQFSKIYFK